MNHKLRTQALQQKFEGLVRPVLGAHATTLAWEKLGAFAEQAKLEELLALFVPAPASQSKV